MDVVTTILRLLLSLTISGGIHYFVWRRLVKRSALPRRWHLGISIAIVLLYLSIPLTTMLRNDVPAFSTNVGWVAYPWMALVALTFVALLIIDVVRRPAPDVSESRRTFLARFTGATAHRRRH